MLLAAAVQHQCKVIDLGIARDDECELEKILEDAFSAGVNILLTSGGVSMGDRDYVKPLLAKKGVVYFNAVCRWLLKCFHLIVPPLCSYCHGIGNTFSGLHETGETSDFCRDQTRCNRK